jgi:eukaryotic-like serine/threonine-protein kinase
MIRKIIPIIIIFSFLINCSLPDQPIGNIGSTSNSDKIPISTPSNSSSIISPTPASQIEKDFLSYENSSVGIRIAYPSNWSKKENPVANPVGTVTVAFLPPGENSSTNTFSDNVTVIVDDEDDQNLIDNKITLKDYTNSVLIAEWKKIITDFKLIESSEITLANNPGMKVVYTGSQNGTKLKYLQVFTMKNNKDYLITYTAMIDKYDSFLENVQKMINSFEITK